jgi:membrane protein
LRDRGFKEFAFYILKLLKGFISELFEPKVSFYAASMSWATLFFMIPLLVIILSVVIYTPIFNQFYSNIHSIIANSLMPGSSKIIMEWIDKFVANAASMGLVGVVYIVVAAVMFFRDFDYIVNDIFDKNRRTPLEALLVYGGLLVFIPLSLGATIWLFSKIDNTLHLAPQILQFIIIWAIIFVIYTVTPRDKLSVKVVALSSFIATFVWFVAKSLFVLYLYYNKTYTTIYGAVSVVLFLFLWIYISWTIFLHGMQLCSVLSDED